MRTLRVLAGWTQEELAEVIGVKQCSISQWETGHCVPTPSRLFDVLAVLHNLKERLNEQGISVDSN